MEPVKFPQANVTYEKPAGWTDDQCAPLPTWTDGDSVVSRWKMTPRERLSALIFGTVWLFVVNGGAQPPVDLQAKREIFTNPKPTRGPLNYRFMMFVFIFFQVMYGVMWLGILSLLSVWGFRFPLGMDFTSMFISSWLMCTGFCIIWLLSPYGPRPKSE